MFQTQVVTLYEIDNVVKSDILVTVSTQALIASTSVSCWSIFDKAKGTIDVEISHW